MISAGAPTKARAAPALAAWMERHTDALFLSAVTVAEIADGIARAAGQAPGFADLAIAATAVAHDLTVLSRNLRHFAPLCVPAADPFAGLPESP